MVAEWLGAWLGTGGVHPVPGWLRGAEAQGAAAGMEGSGGGRLQWNAAQSSLPSLNLAGRRAGCTPLLLPRGSSNSQIT